MTNHFCITIHFLHPFAHGRKNGGEPEWPPSPLRLFQALVAGAAARFNERTQLVQVVPALAWLEKQKCPTIIAAAASASDFPYLLYVPNNTADLLVPAWKHGEITKMVKREQKVVRATNLGGDTVHYLYPLVDDSVEFEKHRATLIDAARSITHLGWGIDMVVGNADVISTAKATNLPGNCWRVAPVGGIPLRVAKKGTLDNLMHNYRAFLNRLTEGTFKPVPCIHCFDVVRYHSPSVTELTAPHRPMAAFELHRTIEDQERREHAGQSRFRPYHPVRQVATVAGMVRHALAEVARGIGWDHDEVQFRIEGHTNEQHPAPTNTEARFQFLPLPSITPVGVGGIRRVLLVGPVECDIAPLRRRLHGQELMDLNSNRSVAMLSSLGTTDKSLEPYIKSSAIWTTVTPVILPGHDDPQRLRATLAKGVTAERQHQLLQRLHTRILALIWKAFHQAGWTVDALEGAEVEYRDIGWLRGLEPARNYCLPPIDYRRYHLRIRFPHPKRGPIAIGAGRFRGMGVFVGET